MLAYLIGLLSGEIEIKVSPDYFIFRRKSQEISIRPVIYISLERTLRVLGVGDDHVPAEPNVSIDLFQPEGTSVGSIDKAECLDAFFRYCFRKIMSRKAFIRPRIVFRNVVSFNGILCGYQRIVLKNAAINAGARECLFQE